MKGYNTKELCLIWLDSFLGLEYRHKQEIYKLINDKTDIKSLIVEAKDYITTEVGVNEYNTLINSANNTYLSFILDGLAKRDITAITVVSKDYPISLQNTDIPPLVLYAKGDINLLKGELFATVGSRKNLPMQINLAKSFTESLVMAGFTIVTGIAQGVDATCIQTALDNNGKVISVIAGGFDNIYPPCNIGLSNEVASKGLLLSEYPPEVVSKKYFFPIRNRIIAGLSLATLVISAGERSGAMYTAEYAESYSRLVFAIPYSPGVQSGIGCNTLIKQGVRLADTPNDILEIMGKSTKQENDLSDLTDEEIQVVETIRESDLHIEKICEILGKPVYEVSALLSGLVIKKAVVVNGNNIYGLKR